MNRIVLLLLVGSLSAVGFTSLRRSTWQNRTITAAAQEELQVATNGLGQTQQAAAALRADVLDKKRRLEEMPRHTGISPELLLLLETDASNGSPTAWAELRQELGIGWDSSPEYVLVSKRILGRLDYGRVSGVDASDTASRILALSPAEKTSIRDILDRARQGQWLRTERSEPDGDIVAQYTIPPPDAGFEQTQSNMFVTGIANILGPERAALFSATAWRQFKSELAPRESETMTIRRSVVDGEPGLICEMQRGTHVATQPVRYANYPSQWFLTLFPGGWQTLADREGFDLPPNFKKQL